MHLLALATFANKGQSHMGASYECQNEAGYWEVCVYELKMLTVKQDAWNVVNCDPLMNVLSSM